VSCKSAGQRVKHILLSSCELTSRIAPINCLLGFGYTFIRREDRFKALERPRPAADPSQLDQLPMVRNSCPARRHQGPAVHSLRNGSLVGDLTLQPTAPAALGAVWERPITITRLNPGGRLDPTIFDGDRSRSSATCSCVSLSLCAGGRARLAASARIGTNIHHRW
jgi:hypothetical protein